MKRHYQLHRTAGRLKRQLQAGRAWLRPIRHKLFIGLATAVVLLGQIMPFWQPHIEAQHYNLSDANNLLPQSSPQLAKQLAYNQKLRQYAFNAGYSPVSSDVTNGGSRQDGGAHIKAVAHQMAQDGVTVTDPLNNVDFSLKPQFDLMTAKSDSNRVYYPLSNGTGWLVYTMQATQVSEDLVLTGSISDQLSFSYQLGLGDSLSARLMKDGSVGIYGSELPINGTVSTSNDKDAALLSKLRQNSTKTKLLFILPRPVIRQHGTNTQAVKASYILKGSSLKLQVSGLKQGKYPLDIDPSVYVQSARGLMYGNNETNTSFDTANNLFQKTPVSGGNIRDGATQTSWSSTTALPTGLWASGVAISGGYIYVVGGSTGTFTSTSASVYWAQLNVTTSTLIGSWTTNTGYDLPVALRHLSVVAYNDYLYAIGGNSGSAVVSTVYKLHLAASGEPTPSWVTGGNALPGGAGLQYGAAVAYQNEIYITGGQTAATGTTGVTAGYTASIKPDGTTGTWSSITALPAALWGHSMASYNGYLYVVGGAVGTTMQTAIYYAQITSPGSIGAWQTNPNSFTTGRSTQGGNFMTIWAGYMYLSGGCGTMNASGYCSVAPQGDIQEASINADGSISAWTTLQFYNTGSSAFANISQPRLGNGLVSFGSAFSSSAANAGGTLYAVGGCSAAQNTGTGACASPLTTATYAPISSEGDIGPAQTTTPLPALAGKFASGVVINNGYIYNVGGCTNNGCTTVTTAIYYNNINANGTLGATWTATTNALPTAVAAMGVAVFNNTIYTVGGATGSGQVASGSFIVLGTAGNSTSSAADGTNPLGTAATYVFAFTHANPSTPSAGYLYTVGGCTTTSGVGCSTTGYLTTVRRCAITTGANPTGCTATGQLQLPTGTGIGAGATYGNYAYLSSGANGGTSGTAGTWGGQTNLTYYVQIDSSGNLVLPPGKSGGTWATVTGRLADNGVTDASSDNAPGQRRRASAYAVNGYLYILGGHDANAQNGSGDTLQDMEIGKMDPTTGDIASFTDNYYQITPRWDFKGAAANGFIYAVGGCSAGAPPSSCTAEDLAVQYMQVYNNYSGSPAAYNSTTANNIGRMSASSAIYNGYIYVAGGCTNVGCTTFTNTVEYAQLNSDTGAIGAWTTSGNTMVTTRNNFKLLASGGYLYAIGGRTTSNCTTALATTEKAQLTAGVPGTWSADATMNSAHCALDAVTYNGYIYVTGGQDAVGAIATVEYSQIGSGTLGAWVTNTNSFVDARSGHQSVAYNGTLYVIGGIDVSGNLATDVQYAQINSNGSVGTFSQTANLPLPVRQGGAFAANGYLYVTGGRSTAAACTSNTYVASIMANSTVASGNVPNGLGSWSQTSVQFTGARYGQAFAYSSGHVYIMGGGCAALTSTSYYSTLQSQPQVAQYSYAIDAINDVFPSKSLFNGIDNGIGASWVLDYRSSTAANATWGLSTNYGKTTLGTPQTYIPLDGSGSNTSFARYYWLELTIDGSQAFGYPEDVTRGPTIANLTVQFTANPSQRLRHGKTFINNVQQPLDAPF